MLNNLPSAAIYGCSGLELTSAERTFFQQQNPLGFILFKRNIANPAQVKTLVAEMKATTTHGMPLMLIDQEGGRVARLTPPYWRATLAAGEVATRAANHSSGDAERALYLHYRLIAAELADLGINVDCAPMLDIPAADSDDIIGDRALGNTAEEVIVRGKAVCHALLDGGVLPVIKHVPGHGRATADSHKTLPIVQASKAELTNIDFAPFAALADMPLAMTAHITYPALDATCCATLSPEVIRIIRRELGFDGLLMTDDLSMHALTGDFASRTRASIEAGCDVVLHCNGNMAEMQAIAAALPPITPEAFRRMQAAWAMLYHPAPFDIVEAERALAQLTA